MVIYENNLKSPGFSHLHNFLNAMDSVAECGSQVGESSHDHVRVGWIWLGPGWLCGENG